MGTLRVFFTSEDLLRVRIAPAPDAAWELVLSLLKLQSRRSYVPFDAWRRSVAGQLGPWIETLRTVAPLRTYFADFLTPPEGTAGMDAAIDAVLHTPVRQLRHEVGLLGEGQRLPTWSHDLAAGRPETMRRLGQALHRYHTGLLAPIWPTVCRAVAEDRSRRLEALAAGGYEAMLGTLSPAMRWRSPVLEARYCVDQELHLEGRGLLLIPSYFCWDTVVSLADPRLTPVLVYPIGVDLVLEAARAGVPPSGEREGEALGALLGPTRASVLQTLAQPCSTTELARLTGVSAATASQHASVLRHAGLVVTQRQGGSVRHSRTALGEQLVTGRRVPAPGGPPARPVPGVR